MRTTPAAVLAAALLTACAPALTRGVPQTPSAPPTAGTRGGAAPLATKRVAAKRPPGTLVAEDATVCVMAPEAFAGAAAGTVVRCAWAPPESAGR